MTNTDYYEVNLPWNNITMCIKSITSPKQKEEKVKKILEMSEKPVT